VLFEDQKAFKFIGVLKVCWSRRWRLSETNFGATSALSPNSLVRSVKKNRWKDAKVREHEYQIGARAHPLARRGRKPRAQASLKQAFALGHSAGRAGSPFAPSNICYIGPVGSNLYFPDLLVWFVGPRFLARAVHARAAPSWARKQGLPGGKVYKCRSGHRPKSGQVASH